MKCIKCGSKLKRNEKFCTECGYYNDPKNFDEEDNNLLSDDEFNLLEDDLEEEKSDKDEEIKIEENEEKPTEEKSNTKKAKDEIEMVFDDNDHKGEEFYNYQDEELLEAYIGEDYKVIKKMPFNIYAFLLSWGYVLYRKLYLTGTIGLIIAAVIITFFRSFIIIYIIASMVVLGFLFNPYYIFVSKRKIESLRSEYDGTDTFTLSSMCEERGGVNVVVALIIYAIFIIFILVSNISVIFNKSNTKFWKENTENKATCMSLVKTAYNNLDELKLDNSIMGAACKVIKTGKTSYDVYLKTKTEDDVIYVYYQTEKESLVYKHDTSKMNDLDLKKANDEITTEEEVILNNIKQLEGNYNDIVKNDNLENSLIDKKKDESEKLNFSFTEGEIIR